MIGRSVTSRKVGCGLPGRIGTRVLALICEPVNLRNGEKAARPISFRDATRAEERYY